MVCRLLLLGCLAVIQLLCGCAALTAPPSQAYETVRPRTPPIRNLTSFSPALRCMDDLFLTYGIGEKGSGAFYLTSHGVPDKTGKGLGGDNRDVLIATISRMCAKSQAIKFIDYDPRNLQPLGEHLGTHPAAADSFIFPRYELLGALTTLDENVSAKTIGLSLAFSSDAADADLGWSKDQLVTVVGVDFNISEAGSRQIVNGLTASNQIAIVRRGVAGDGGGRYKKAGLFFQVSLDKNEGIYAAFRALIELSVMEVLGKLTRVPYWECLQIEHTNPEVLALTNEWFATMTTAEQVRVVQRLLARYGYYSGAAHSRLDNATRQAIARYQAATDLVPSGRIDLALYRQLISGDLAERVEQAQTAEKKKTKANVATLVAAKPLLSLTTPRGSAPVYTVHERLSLAVQVSQNAYLYCFHRDGHQQVTRVYPNRFQPGAYVQARQKVQIPAAAHFSLSFDVPQVTEAVLCLAVPEAIEAQIPPHLQPDLERLPVTRLEDVAAVFRRLAPETLAEAQLLIRVQP